MNTEKQLYPTKRQKALINNAEIVAQGFQKNTSASIMLFRYLFRIILILYAIMIFTGLWEIIAGMFINTGFASKADQVLSFGKSLFVMVFAGISYMLHNQILLILGHGYKDKSAQLFVDTLTPLDECLSDLKTIKSMYAFSVFVGLIGLWILWGFWGTPLYQGLLSAQLDSVHAIIETMSQQISASNYEGYPKGATKLKPALIVSSLCMLIGVLLSITGWVNAFISQKKSKA